MESITYILTWKPKVLLFENVAAMVEQRPHKERFATFVKILETAGYDVHCQVLNSSDYNLPQWRRRVYMIGVHKGHLRTNNVGIKWFPDSVPLTRTLASIVKRSAHFKMLPDKSDLHKTNGKSALEGAARMGINPFTTPVVIDVGVTPGYMGQYNWRSSLSMTLTETRSSSFGYWCSTKGDYLNIEEMAALQGYDDLIDCQAADVSNAQYAGCLGAAQSLKLVEHVLPHALYMARLIDLGTFNKMKAVC